MGSAGTLRPCVAACGPRLGVADITEVVVVRDMYPKWRQPWRRFSGRRAAVVRACRPDRVFDSATGTLALAAEFVQRAQTYRYARNVKDLFVSTVVCTLMAQMCSFP